MTLLRYYFQSGTQSYRDLVLGMAPAAYYPLDDASGNFADLSGNGYTATVSGTPVFGATGPTIAGVVQSAVTFDGATDYATASEAIDDGVTTATGMTLAFWVKTADAGDSNPISKAAASNKTWDLYYNGDPNNEIDFYTYQTDGSTSHGASFGQTSLDDGAWHHWIMVVSATDNYLYTYLDGQTEFSDETVAGTWNAESDSQLTIGGPDGAANFDGSLAHIAFWRRVLTAAERASLYSGV
ncbi:MAG TPA: LamG domain-containing protein [Actinomycetes bacterium]|nr:LamG domain-containing protein [Actinomycetes bacterium]